MLRLTVAVLTVALAGTASAAGWRSLRLDASDEASFTKSVAAFEENLSPAQWYAFTLSLHDIWYRGTNSAAAEGREYTDAEYLRQLHGLRYVDVVKFTDPTGKTETRYRAAYNASRPRGAYQAQATPGATHYREQPRAPIGWSGEQVRGIDDQHPAERWATRP